MFIRRQCSGCNASIQFTRRNSYTTFAVTATFRYKECREKLTPYLKKLGYNMKHDVMFVPCSGLTGAYIKDAPEDAAKICPWYK